MASLLGKRRTEASTTGLNVARELLEELDGESHECFDDPDCKKCWASRNSSTIGLQPGVQQQQQQQEQEQKQRQPPPPQQQQKQSKSGRWDELPVNVISVAGQGDGNIAFSVPPAKRRATGPRSQEVKMDVQEAEDYGENSGSSSSSTSRASSAFASFIGADTSTDFTIRFPVIGAGADQEHESEWETNDLHDYCENFADGALNYAPEVEVKETDKSKAAAGKREASRNTGSSNPKQAGASKQQSSRGSNISININKQDSKQEREDAEPDEEEWCGMDEQFALLLEATSEHEEEVRDQRRPVLRSVATNSRLNTQAVTAGDLRERAIRKALDSMGLVRTKQQKQFHEAAILSTLPSIYGSELETKRAAIMKAKKIKEIRSEVLVMTPRRYGKTTMVAMIAAALLYCVPGIRIVIFSTGKRASQALMDLIVKFLCLLKGGQSRICKKNQETLGVAARPLGVNGMRSEAAQLASAMDDTSILMSFPANEKGAFI